MKFLLELRDLFDLIDEVFIANVMNKIFCNFTTDKWLDFLVVKLEFSMSGHYVIIESRAFKKTFSTWFLLFVLLSCFCLQFIVGCFFSVFVLVIVLHYLGIKSLLIQELTLHLLQNIPLIIVPRLQNLIILRIYLIDLLTAF